VLDSTHAECLREPISKFTTAEKLMAMEALWSSLHQNFEESDPPDWHRGILNHRMKLIESGEAVYDDWNLVKKELRERTT
jgi:Putative addiction module component